MTLTIRSTLAQLFCRHQFVPAGESIGAVDALEEAATIIYSQTCVKCGKAIASEEEW